MNKITACGMTDTGMKRSRNEDSYAVEPDYGLFIVADGMGGHTDGDTASSTAVRKTAEFAKTALADSEITWPFGIDHTAPREINIISTGIRLANKSVFSESKGMGTTIVALLIKDETAYICHVGDSRAYRIRDNKIRQITEDHSLVAEELKRGAITKEQARNYPLRHVITRAVGMTPDVRSDCNIENIMSGDIFLLCSDGLSGMLEDDEILDIILKNKSADEQCKKLIKEANEKGGNDNITAVVVRCG